MYAEWENIHKWGAVVNAFGDGYVLAAPDINCDRHVLLILTRENCNRAAALSARLVLTR